MKGGLYFNKSSTKIYFRDSGIFNSLMSIRSLDDLVRNPKIGALWEGFALEQVLNCFQVRNEEAYFWATQNDAELDLLIFKNGELVSSKVGALSKSQLKVFIDTAI